ncbi:MAG: oligosaccharide flippase family protein [Bacteroidaceae bacterium]|nr:oligosaccharide flippase family protein [Bacteroidaceae bacterium]
MNKGNVNRQIDDDATYDHVIKYTGLFGGVQGLNMLVNIARNKLTAWLLGPVGTGVISLLSNFIELLHHSTDLGLCFSSLKHVSELFGTGDEQRISRFIQTVRLWCLMAGLMGMLISMSIAPFVTWTDPLNVFIISPIIGTLTVIAGEQAILKGTKQLKTVAVISVLSTIATLVITVPIYFIFGIMGIAVALLLNHCAILLLTLRFSTRRYPYRLFSSLIGEGRPFLSRHFSAGVPMLILGVGYVIAGVFGKGAEFVIRHFILEQAPSLEQGEVEVGLYTSGYTIMVSYASYIFTAMEVDFFPRLSAAAHDMTRSNRIINQQIEVCALLIAPLLVCLVLLMPHLLHLLYAQSYHNAIPMAVCASMLMFFKAFFGPVEYLALAKGDSRMYMFVELCYDIAIAVLIPLSYSRYGLMGCGIALSVIGFLNAIFVYSLYSWKYRFRFHTRHVIFHVIQFILLLTTILAVMHGVTTTEKMLKWSVGPICVLMSVFISFRILHRETTVIQTLKQKICRKSRS